MDYWYQIELKIYYTAWYVSRPAIGLWSSLYIEWVAVQGVMLYSIFRLYNTINYLRQVLAMMWFVIVTCLYLSLWQLELFSCFLFLGEFTILIFFYCLFLHLKASITQQSSSHNIIGGQYIAVALLLIISLWVITKPYMLGFKENSIAYALDLYNSSADFSLNDLTSLFFYFTAANITLHALIGVILFIVTLLLFTTVTLYVSTSLLKKTVYNNAQSKLFVPRGYYEQTSQTSQKFFSQSSNDKK